jgi:hypothetical protein
MWNSLKMKTKAKTQLGRGFGCRTASIHGAQDSDIRRHGRWNNQALENCYLTSLPRGSIRALAGFPPEKGYFFLPRASIAIPVELQNMVFPQLNTAL